MEQRVTILDEGIVIETDINKINEYLPVLDKFNLELHKENDRLYLLIKRKDSLNYEISGMDMTQEEYNSYITTAIDLLNSPYVNSNIRLDLMLQMLYENKISLGKARSVLDSLHSGYDSLFTKEFACELINKIEKGMSK